MSEQRTYNEERGGYDVIGPCWTCGTQVSYFTDEDGTPRDITPLAASERPPVDPRDTVASLVRGDYGNPDWPRPPVDPLREALFAALEELPRQTVHADPFFSDTTYEYETVGLAVALATVEAVCASFAPSSATASSGSGSTSATGASGSPLLGLAAERLREAAQNALDRGESVGSYHHRAVINALESASPAVPPEGLDVERLRAAISEAQMNLWGRFPGGFSHDDLSAEAAHIYGLSDTGDTPDGAS